ncbi:MAG: NAD-dependent succinate-semialdehyde dehydrogenase [Verrucomicrobiota bacterium]|nr:NAD-dependent succinate-semialdehyde dehydrogenase [Verrucomicrobiota bacterium]
MALVSINPATGRRMRAYREHTSAEIFTALSRADAVFNDWRELSFAERTRHLRALAKALRAQRDKLASLMTAEMGKPITQARAEIDKCALACEHFARYAAALLADEHPPGAPKKSRVTFAPLGVVLAIMPWNFPFWQLFRAAAPALMAGNVLLLKHSSNVCGCAAAIEKVFAAAGLPRHVLQTLLISLEKIPALIADPRVHGVTLTGSTEAGQRVAALAGGAMKKSVFELGGSDAYVVLADADLDHAAKICAEARLINNGQSCIAAKRFIVTKPVRVAFEKKFTACMAAQRMGDPMDETTQVGPLAREDLRAALHKQVLQSVRRGARLLLGGKLPGGAGFFYPPTVLTDIAKGMPAYDKELFGPVAAIIPVRDDAEALAVANDSDYGLGAAVFTRSRNRAAVFARGLEAGVIFINDFVRSDPSLPFGGVKQSGFGRELGPAGIREFANIKTVVGM